MSTYGAILGASIGVILLCLVVVVACYVLYAVSHMKALKACLLYTSDAADEARV